MFNFILILFLDIFCSCIVLCILYLQYRIFYRLLFHFIIFFILFGPRSKPKVRPNLGPLHWLFQAQLSQPTKPFALCPRTNPLLLSTEPIPFAYVQTPLPHARTTSYLLFTIAPYMHAYKTILLPLAHPRAILSLCKHLFIT